MQVASLKLTFILLLLFLPLALAARKAQKGENVPGPARAPASAQAKQNPYAGEKDAELAGRQLFARYCVSCHGPDARGRGKAPALDSPQVQDVRAGALFWYLKNGDLKRGMPSWTRLPDAQLWQLVSFLQSLN